MNDLEKIIVEAERFGLALELLTLPMFALAGRPPVPFDEIIDIVLPVALLTGLAAIPKKREDHHISSR